MQIFLIDNNFSFIGGGFATIRDDVVWKNPRGDDLSNVTPCQQKWNDMVPMFAYHRLYLVVDGHATFLLTDGTSLRLEKNKLYLISPFMIRSAEKTELFSHYFLHFKSNTQSTDPFEFYKLVNPVDAQEPDAVFFKMLLSTYFEKDMRSRMVAQGYFSLLISKFFDGVDSQPPVIKKFEPILEYIERNIGKKITVSDLASVLGYNDSYFSVIFSKCFKITPQKYVANKKMILARQQLAHSSLSIKEISENLGFDSEFYFGNVFKKSVGLSPGRWRKRYFEQLLSDEKLFH